MSDDVEGDPPVAVDAGLAVTLAEVRAWLRLGADEAEDGLLILLVGAAAGLCEAFIGRWLIVRDGEWRGRLMAGERGVHLPAGPVVAVDEAALLDGDVETLLGADDFEVRIERDGAATLRLPSGFGVREMVVRYRAGMAETAEALPDALRHGVLRMVQHLYETRDRPSGSGEPPAVVAALWQPWRRVTLGGVR